ncbi:MAG TPA: FAD-binding protein [Lacipirellulaceae bacterium]|nr:FAD-binding protein [Lacipirellulaceae bacterium]
MRTLAIAEHDGKALRPASLSCLTFAQSVANATGGNAAWLLLGHHVNSVAADAAQFAPTLVVDSPSLAQPLADSYARTIATVVRDRQFDLLCAAASTFSKDILPRAAAFVGGAMASDVLRHELFDRQLHLDCPQYAGAVTATLRLLGTPQVVTVRASAYPPAKSVAANAHPIESLTIDAALLTSRAVHEGIKSKRSARPDVTEAKVVISGGRAIKNSEDYERLVGRLADVLGGATGSSRALVDAGITPNELQVGQTGKIVAPQLYVALGISGAVQHLAGMKNSRTIVAINSDPNAPIFDVADYGLVGDVYAIVPELIEKLQNHAACRGA